ncbi:hypothetical protein S40288_08440 [Stachybotrys chartarum IBT 40288]|nr:hypothetical protein S40288_08440 [Stachybotrys chartarum IBT 40288]
MSNIVFISGANRGLGLGLLQRYLALDDHTVIAGNRNPEHSSSKTLSQLPKGKGSKLIVVKLDAAVDQDAANAVTELQHKHAIDHLDVVIANAGVSYAWPTVADAKLDDVRAHLAPNVLGVIALYQATRLLLQNSSKEPIFAPISSSAGCIANQPPIPNACYGPTKAALNWYIVRINSEDAWLNAFSIDPGLVQTDLGLAGARHFGFADSACITVDVSCDGMVKVLGDSAKEKNGGRMIGYDGETRGF